MTEQDVKVIDPEDPDEAELDWRRIGLPNVPLGVVPIAEINWATSGPGIEWPQSYALGRGGAPLNTILWVFDPDDEVNPVGVDRAWYPGAWYGVTDIPPEESAETLLRAFWQVQADTGHNRPQEILIGGILDEADMDRLADDIWPLADRKTEDGVDTYDDPEIQALYETIAPMFDDMQRAVDKEVAGRRAIPAVERRLSPYSELQRAAGRLLLRIANSGDPLPEPEVGCDFIGGLTKGTPLASWSHLDAGQARICTLWLHYVAGHQAICVRVLGKSESEGTVYGLIPADAPETEQLVVIRELFSRNGHQDAPLFRALPDVVVHGDNAPGTEAAPVYGVKQARELFRLLPAAESGGFDEWFRQATDPRSVREVRRTLEDFLTP